MKLGINCLLRVCSTNKISYPFYNRDLSHQWTLTIFKCQLRELESKSSSENQFTTINICLHSIMFYPNLVCQCSVSRIYSFLFFNHFVENARVQFLCRMIGSGNEVVFVLYYQILDWNYFKNDIILKLEWHNLELFTRKIVRIRTGITKETCPG